jgi:hypothetical protein
MLLPDPSIKASPPPGWFDAPEDAMEYFSEALQEEWPEVELDYIFVNNSDNNAIIIDHREIPATADIPDTEDMEEMQSYIAQGEEDIKESIIGFGDAELESYEAVPMECGDIAIHVGLSYHVGGTGSTLIVREGNTLFYIHFLIYNLDKCSEEIEHLCQTISFD